jgi:nitrogen fixation protein NifQ
MFIRHYATLMAGQWPAIDAATAFDTHALACVLATALGEVEAGEATITQATGLGGREIGALLDRRFPAVARSPFRLDEAGAPGLEMEEEMLRDLLVGHLAPTRRGEGGCAYARDGVGPEIAVLIARRAMRPDHLWQDLGLFDRSELNRLLATHFPALHAGNTANMRWKKYFYRTLCEAEGFSLCTAPSCAQCADFAACFGSEDGESRMAQTRRAVDLAGVVLAAE